MHFPKIDDVASELRAINKHQLEPEDANEGIDVRLQVYANGDWAVRSGLSDYDQDHRGYWGASSVPGNNRRFDSKSVARDLISQAKDAFAEGVGFDEAPQRRVQSRRQPSLPGFPDIPEKLDIQIPNMPQWEQIGGDMSPGAHGGTIARSDGDDAIELLEIQPVRSHVGDREAADVGFPFWTREAYFNLSDLDPDDKGVQSALRSSGFTEGERKSWFEEEATPAQRALVIAEALLSYGHAEEGPSGWSEDIIHEPVKWWGGKTAGAEYLADEDQEFAQEVLLDDLDVDYEKYGPDEKEPTSGLKVTANSSEVEVTEWTDIEDATGETQPEDERISRQSATVALSELFDTNGKHRGSYSGDDKSVDIVALAKMNETEREDAIVSAAIAYLGYWGGDEEFVDAIGD